MLIIDITDERTYRHALSWLVDNLFHQWEDDVRPRYLVYQEARGGPGWRPGKAALVTEEELERAAGIGLTRAPAGAITIGYTKDEAREWIQQRLDPLPLITD